MAGGLLYWPFEDARFSMGRGEYVVTDGRRWRWATLPSGDVFHVHAFAVSGGALFAATSAWRAGLQRSDDGGATWRVIYDHPTPAGLVSRITALTVLDDVLYAALSASEGGAKLLRLHGDTLDRVAGWPAGSSVDALAAYRGEIYAVNVDSAGAALWRTNGRRTERVTALDGHRVRALAAGRDAVWAVTARGGGGALWRSSDGQAWVRTHTFEGEHPVDVAVYAEHVYVGTHAPGRRGALWGPPPPAPVEPRAPSGAWPATPRVAPLFDPAAALARLDRALSDATAYAHRVAGLRAALEPLALSGLPAAADALSRRLNGPFATAEVRLFGGALRAPAAKVARWHLLWALATLGHGRVPPALLAIPWGATPNRAAKYLEPTPAAARAATVIGQDDEPTLAALVGRLGAPGQPAWLDGDLVGALTALTGERFGYDRAAWRAWWSRRRATREVPVVRVPQGDLRMGSEAGEPAERPVHRVTLRAFAIDRFEVTNAEFAEFVHRAGHVTDPERARVGWHWEGTWREVPGADWRHPRGPGSSIDGLEQHPVVQISWNDATAYCRWRSARLPTEAEWERAARGTGDRIYPWGDESPRGRASYGNDACCRADAGDGHLYTAPVGAFPRSRSPFGVDDLAGNVWEWVEDWFAADFYARSSVLDPVNRVPATRKVIRGGGWGNDAAGLRSTLRHANPPDIGLSMVGFRCARDVVE
jgi:formylglycine-generating enzyme required for sulfatase activity